MTRDPDTMPPGKTAIEALRLMTVCLAPIQGSVAVTDRMALQRRPEHLGRFRQAFSIDAGTIGAD
jgi:hypothetical protein